MQEQDPAIQAQDQQTEGHVKSNEELADQVTRIAGKIAMRAEKVNSPNISTSHSYGESFGTEVKLASEDSDQSLSIETATRNRMTYEPDTANLTKESGATKIRVHAAKGENIDNYGNYYRTEKGSTKLNKEQTVKVAASLLSEARGRIARAEKATPKDLDALLKSR